MSRFSLPHISERTRAVILAFIAAGLIFAGGGLLWAATLPLPSIETIQQARMEQSTKIYDRTGEVLLYDLHQNVKRTVVPYAEISQDVKNATIAIEDAGFYSHIGIEPKAILRAILVNFHLRDGYLGQGGSTITQQVVKNSILESKKTIPRKVKEWVLAIKLEKALSKDEILELYLNVSPYGGNKYGIEEASQAFFGKSAKDITLAESAYLAALPQAPTYYSPYGNNFEALKKRKNLVLDRMLEHKMISPAVHDAAKREDVKFLPPQATGIKAPHFVFFVIQQLEDKFGQEALEAGGYKVTTTLDWNLESAAEKIVYTHALENEKKYKASNAALVAIDPKNGEILTMVGSRDYFDDKIDGNYNITLAHRQPGSSFKPFAYAAALLKGYTPETVVFDAQTQFSTSCEAGKFVNDGTCYAPVNYDGIYRGPVTFRNALAQSINIPAIKVLYLAGIKNTLNLAESLGITTLGDYRRYGLTLVLGGGEVTPLDMTHAYTAFANQGKQFPIVSILKIEDKHGEIIEEVKKDEVESKQVLDQQVALQITDILADNVARAPAFGSNSYLFLPGYDVAVKTGTTNEYRDAWVIGYTPDIVVGAWSGNNDNSSMEKKVAGFIVAPMWNEFMQEAFKQGKGAEKFTPPDPIPYDTLKPVLRGVWQGNQSLVVDKTTGEPATDSTPPEQREERFVPNVHDILYWVNKDDPRGPIPQNPSSDSQFGLWEYGVALWLQTNGSVATGTASALQGTSGTLPVPELNPKITIVNPNGGQRIQSNDRVTVRIKAESDFTLTRADFFINNTFLGTVTNSPFSFSFRVEDIDGIQKGNNTLRVVGYDDKLNKSEALVTVEVR